MTKYQLTVEEFEHCEFVAMGIVKGDKEDAMAKMHDAYMNVLDRIRAIEEATALTADQIELAVIASARGDIIASQKKTIETRHKGWEVLADWVEAKYGERPDYLRSALFGNPF